MAVIDSKRPILANGEHYISKISKKSGPHIKDYPRSYDAAREVVLASLTKLEESVESIPKDKFLPETLIFCLRLNENFIAKSYHPGSLINEARFNLLGSRRWYRDPEKKILSKVLFIKSSISGLDTFKSLFDRKVSFLSDAWCKDARKIEEVSLLKANEQLLGFSNWDEGFVEFVLHPLNQQCEEAVQKMFQLLKSANTDLSTFRVSPQYGGGIKFISGKVNKEQLHLIENYNPLRTAHPLPKINVPTLRNSKFIDAPKPFPDGTRSIIKVGMFDGGTDPKIPLLSGHVNETSLTKGLPVNEFLQHGVSVAGCILYGKLNDYSKNNATVPQPKVSVESFRVFPSSDPKDIDLYDVIDEIEATIPNRADIKVYNLSFGPKGIILDDDISRFTMALDSLSYHHKVLFVVAVGNDGNESSPWNRIQAPADIINGLGVGAATFKVDKDKVTVKKADYSSIGPGREGCKVKPDVTAFGGCENHPVHLIGATPNTLVSSFGTSFSSPMVAGLAGELMGRCERINALMARILLVHSADHPDGSPDVNLGHGCVKSDAEEIIQCTDKGYTVLFQSSWRIKSCAKLSIPFVINSKISRKVNFKWTVGTLSRPDPRNPDEYSNTCIEDTFYSNTQKFNFSKMINGKLKTKSLDLRHSSEEGKELLGKGWKKSDGPTSDSGKHWKLPEIKRRGLLKWDTIVHKTINKHASGVFEPFLVVHSQGRNENEGFGESVDYAVAVTVEIPKYEGNIYKDILQAFNKLRPLEVRAINEIQVPIN